MILFYFLANILLCFYLYKFYIKLFNLVKDLFYIPNKSFEDVNFELSKPEDYHLLSYNIFYESGDIVELDELNEESLKTFEENEEDVIKFIQIVYLFKNVLYKFITYDKDITFPIYDIHQQNSGIVTIDSFYIDDKDFTSVIKPYIGPNNNFYSDKGIKFNLKDIFSIEGIWSPFTEENKNSVLKIKDSQGKEIERDLNWIPVWKPRKDFNE